MGSSILWVLFIAWAITCLYYAGKIVRIIRERGVSVFFMFSKEHKNSYSGAKARKILLYILVTTVIFIVTILIAYFVRSSS